MKTPTLETERLILRPISLDDAPALRKYFDNWSIVRYTHAPWPLPEGCEVTNIKETIELIEAGKQMSWVIMEKEQEEVIGRIDYRLNIDPPSRGFWMAQPFQGRGYMTEVVSITQDYMFFEYGLEKLLVSNFKGNAASKRIKEKTGARYTGDKTEIVRGEEVELDVWEVTRENWAKIRGRSID